METRAKVSISSGGKFLHPYKETLARTARRCRLLAFPGTETRRQRFRSRKLFLWKLAGNFMLISSQARGRVSLRCEAASRAWTPGPC